MNIHAKPPRSRPFQRRKPAMLPQATASAETFVRYVTAQAHAQLVHDDPLAIANRRWPADARVRTVIRAVSEPPADLSNTPALAVVATDFITSLQPISAAAQLMSAGLLLNFDRYARIVLPDFTGLDDLPTPFVGAGQPAPVAEMSSSAPALEPYKIELIVTATKEMILGGNAERLIGDALKRSAAFALDKALFDAHPGDANRPPGLRTSARLAESVAINNETAMQMDVGRLVGASEHVAAAAPFYFIGRSRRMSAMRMLMKQVPPNFVLLSSAAGQALPESALLCVVPLGFASAVGLPEVELVESATVEMNDAPGSPDLSQAQRVRSMFQTDTVGIKIRIPASWALRTPDAANWITCIWPSDIGGGGEGMPEAPYDEFHYGRHQGTWAAVCEEPPATPTGTGYVRTSYGAPGGWYAIDNFGFASLNSPAFIGTPTAPTPPQGDVSSRLATTQFVRENAGEGGGGGGGVEEVPETPGVYARTRLGGVLEWSDFGTLKVASLAKPIFETGGSPTSVGVGIGDLSTGYYRSGNVVVWSIATKPVMQLMDSSAAFFVPLNMGNQTIQAVADPVVDTDALNRRTGDGRYLQRGGGIMDGPLVAARGLATLPGLAVGDTNTGLYRQDNDLGFSVAGFPIFYLYASREAAITGPLTMSMQRIMALADATTGTDALNRQSADARYLQLTGGALSGNLILNAPPVLATHAATRGYVDQTASPRAPTVIFDIPVDYPIAHDDTWKILYTANFPIPRGGNSLVMVSLSCNVKDVSAIKLIGARIQGNPERIVWAYGATAPNISCGFTVNLYAEVSGNNPAVVIELKPVDGGAGAAPAPFTVVGGGPTVADRSQICIFDLGPR
jgi:hypothetical protein